jgi:hypothetical protein
MVFHIVDPVKSKRVRIQEWPDSQIDVNSKVDIWFFNDIAESSLACFTKRGKKEEMEPIHFNTVWDGAKHCKLLPRKSYAQL